MSNVLIGIIGVILFIGLALAGALFLGPRFQQASASSQGAAVMTSLKQVADAGELWKTQEGRSFLPASGTGFLVPGYLKSAPGNPSPDAASGGYYRSVHFDNNIHLYDQPEVQYAAKYVIAVVGPDTDARAKDICGAISRTYGTPSIPDFSTNSDPHPAADAGCFLGYSLTSTDAKASAAYVAYLRIAPITQSIVQPSGF